MLFQHLFSCFRKPKYQRLDAKEDLSDNVDAILKPKASGLSRTYLLLQALLTLANLVLFIKFVDHHLEPHRPIWFSNLKNPHTRHVSFPSPIIEELDIEPKDQVFNSSFFDSYSDNIFRQAPSAEVDSAWDTLTQNDHFLVSREDIIKAGKDPEVSVRAPKSWNVGEDKYIAKLEGSHQLHCLDVVRRQVYADHYYPQGTSSSRFYWPHVNHCIEILRQSLLCSFNTEIVTFNWMETQLAPYPDFRVNHKCRDHQAIIKWQTERASVIEDKPDFAAPADAVVMPMEPGYYDIIRGSERHMSRLSTDHHHD